MTLKPQDVQKTAAAFDGTKSLETAMKETDRDEKVVDLPVDKIAPNRFQPRKYFDRESLEELANSIRTKGVLEPVVVRRIDTEDSPFLFELAIGERRLRASKLAGKETIPAIVREISDKEMKSRALIENLQREDLTAFETMMSIKDIKEDFDSVEDVMNEANLKKRSVEQYLRFHSEISSVPDVFLIVEKQQADLRKGDLDTVSNIMNALRKYSKSDKRELERFLRKAKEKGVKVAAENLLRKIQLNRKQTAEGRRELGDNNGGFLCETEKAITLKITVDKNRAIPEERADKIKEEIDNFLLKIEKLVKTVPQEAGT